MRNKQRTIAIIGDDSGDVARALGQINQSDMEFVPIRCIHIEKPGEPELSELSKTNGQNGSRPRKLRNGKRKRGPHWNE